jgi:hypothetical protein
MSAPPRSLTLSVLRDRYAILRFAPDAAVPTWATQGEFCSITRTTDELSIVGAAQNAPSADQPTDTWRVLKVHGPFQFDEIGILASLATPLAAAQIGIFVISTFDTDYLLVQSKDIRKAIATLQAAGHTMIETDLIFKEARETEA